METQEIRVLFGTNYSGNPKCEVSFDDGEKWYILEIEQVKNILKDLIISKGYEITKTKLQKYERININS